MSLTTKPITRSTSSSSVLSNDGNNNKNKRPMDGVGDDEDVGSLSDLWSKIQQSNASIEAKIDAGNTKLYNRIKDVEDQLAGLRDECTSNINKLADAVTEVRTEIKITSQRLDHFEMASDLIIAGIPYVRDENLHQMFQALATCLAYKDSEVPLVDLKRLMRLPITSGASPPIACQFAFKNARDEFYRRYLSTRNLSLHHVGFDSDQRVYINENLTKQAREIRAVAIKMKKKGMLRKVFTRSGVVYVQVDEGDAVQVNDVEHLKTLSK